MFRRHFSPNAFLIVGIGATECGGNFAHWFVDERLRTAGGRLPIGRVLPDARVTIETDGGRPVGDGEVGEFVLASRYIALGYWQEPASTAQAFAPDPADSATRIFKTNDMGRMRPDGLLEYVGRNDQMVKLRGYRVEIGEIEFVLNACAGVEDAAVVVRRNEAGLTPSLAAYVERKPGVDHLTPRHLVAALRMRLPGYMIPATMVMVDDLPRLPNFKIDREELRRRDQREAERSLPAPSSQIEGRTKIEEALLELWRDVLNRPDIGCDDDFFLSGGDSVSAVDLLLRIEEQFQYQTPLTVLAEAPTVSQLAGRLETITRGAINNVVRINTAGRRRPLFAVNGTGGRALGLLPVLRSLGPDQPCYGLQPPGMDWTSVGCATLPKIAAYYISEVKAAQPRGPYRLLGVSFGGIVAFEMALQLQRTGESVEFLAMVDTQPPTCLFEGRVDPWQRRLLMDAPSPPVGVIEALNVRIGATHERMRRDYVLDSQFDQHIFRGELTYFHCTGCAVVAGDDRRRLWRRFASRFRLLQLPGAHASLYRDPQYTALKNLLGDCFNDEALTGSDPARVFDRIYRIENRDNGESILGSMGDVYRIDRDRIQGHVDAVRTDAETIQYIGWAVEPCQRQPAQTIAAFHDDQFLGYGACGELRLDVAKHLAANSAQYAGFNFVFPRSAAVPVMGRSRLFVLSSDGQAAELGVERPGSPLFA